jgi:hypothetical protein
MKNRLLEVNPDFGGVQVLWEEVRLPKKQAYSRAYFEICSILGRLDLLFDCPVSHSFILFSLLSNIKVGSEREIQLTIFA